MGWKTKISHSIKVQDKIRVTYKNLQYLLLAEGVVKKIDFKEFIFEVTFTDYQPPQVSAHVKPGDLVKSNWNNVEVWEPDVVPEPPSPRVVHQETELEFNMRLVRLRQLQSLQNDIARARKEGRTLDAFAMTLELSNYRD